MTGCIFCSPKKLEIFNEIIMENDGSYLVKDNFPVSPGHLLIISKEHFDDWFCASLEVQNKVITMLEYAKCWLIDNYAPEGFNIGTNCGIAAGQSVFHLHFHIIPRYTGDHNNPRGGITRILRRSMDNQF